MLESYELNEKVTEMEECSSSSPPSMIESIDESCEVENHLSVFPSYSYSSMNSTRSSTGNVDNSHEASFVSVATMSESPTSVQTEENIFEDHPHLSVTTASQSEARNVHRLFNNVLIPSVSRRESANIQLYALLNDPEESLPTFNLKIDSMSVEDISKQLNAPQFIIERLLIVLGFLSINDDSSSISQVNLIKLTRVLNSTLDVRILLFFLIINEDGNNYITANEMSHFLDIYFNNISFNMNSSQEVIRTFLQRFHLDKKSEIDFEEFHCIISEDLTILESFSRFTINPTWFFSPPSVSDSNFIHRCYSNLCCQLKFSSNCLKNNRSYVVVIVLYILLNVGLSLYVVIYRSVVLKSHVFIVLARICGMLLNLNCSLILILMLKQTILLIRSKKYLRQWIPVDSYVDFHKLLGLFIGILSVLHSISHMINFGLDSSECDHLLISNVIIVLLEHSWVTFMFTRVTGIGWIGGLASISGIILCVILCILIICSLNCVRHKGYFQVNKIDLHKKKKECRLSFEQIFYWTHRFYLVFFVFLIIHGRDFWKWVIGPLLWFIFEKIYSNWTRYSSRTGRTYLNSATIEQSNVISLNIHRPKNFTFKPGDYININLPEVALYEFHPLTISSGPEETDILRVHIQAIGNWTKRVYQRFKNISENNNNNETHIKVYRADLNDQRENVVDDPTTIKLKKEIILLDGPYSSCARYIFDCKHVVLICAGIGVTPYASILSSLMAQHQQNRRNYRIKKVDFIWVNRDHKSFEWFLNLLQQFEEKQETSIPDEQRFLRIHLYLTEIVNNQSLKHFPFQLICQIWNQITGKDIFTNLKARTHIGRPVWDEIFAKLRSNENGSTANDVSVFFCGPSHMNTILKQHCHKYNFRFYQDKF